MTSVLINVKAGIEHIADRIEPHRDDKQQTLQITDETVVEVLYQCENIVEKLLTEAKRRSGGRGQQDVVVASSVSGGASSLDSGGASGSSDFFADSKDTLELAQQVTDRQVMETRPFNQRVTLPTGDANLDSIAEDDREDDGDGRDSMGPGGDDDELTRDKIKRASSAFTTQHDRAQRKKERKGKGKKKAKK
jgi:hypothetical protein